MAISQQELAELSGYSRITVSKALNDHPNVPVATRNKIKRLAEKHLYRPSAAALAMRGQHTRMIGVLVRSATDAPYTTLLNDETIRGIYGYLGQAGYEMCLVYQADIGKRSRIFSEHMLDGVIILSPMGDNLTDEARDAFSTYVCADVNIDESTRCVRRDEFHAGCLVGQAIAQRGYEEVLWLANLSETKVPHYSEPQRLAGLRHGLGPQLSDQLESYLVTCQTRPEFFERLKHVDHKTAIVPYNTPIAQLTLEMLVQHHLFPGQDVGVVCPDDNINLRQLESYLCRVSFDRMQLGQEAARLLLEQLTGAASPSVLLRGQWIEGQTLPYRHRK